MPLNRLTSNKAIKSGRPKKNLFNGILEPGSIQPSNGVYVPVDNCIRSKALIEIKPNTIYSLTDLVGVKGRLFFYTKAGVFISYADSSTTVSPATAFLVSFRYLTGDLSVQIQLEEGQPTPFSPYALVAKKATQGLLFDGIKQYLTIPVANADRIEIDCEFTADVEFNDVLIDLRSASANSTSFVRHSGANVGNLGILLNGVPFADRFPINQRVKITFIQSGLNGNAFIFSSTAIGSFAAGIIYGIKVLNGDSVVDTYDLTSPSNITGDKVLQATKNILPPFNSASWLMHPNFKVAGKDFGTMQSVGIYTNDYYLDLTPNAIYCVGIVGSPGAAVLVRNEDGSALVSNVTEGYAIFTTGTNPGRGYLRMYSKFTGEHTFRKPFLARIPKAPGVLYGGISRQIKGSKRSLFIKR